MIFLQIYADLIFFGDIEKDIKKCCYYYERGLNVEKCQNDPDTPS
jgi:hypothetical protein